MPLEKASRRPAVRPGHVSGPAVPRLGFGGGVLYLLNNKLLPLASDTMPLWSGGVLYVPASLFDGSATNASYGVTLGVSLTQSQSSGTITLYSLSGILVFDLNSGICVDQQTGELLSGRAITRNGRIYLPPEHRGGLFRARSSYLHTDYGYLVRIKNRDDTASNGRRSILTDDVFIDSAGNQMNLQLKEYQKSLLLWRNLRPPDVTPSGPRRSPGPGAGPHLHPHLSGLPLPDGGGVGQHPHHFGEIRKIRRLLLRPGGALCPWGHGPPPAGHRAQRWHPCPGRHPGGGPSGSWRQGTAPWRSRPAAAPAMSTGWRGPVGGAGGGGLGLLAGEPGRRSSGRGAERRLLLLRRSAPAGPGCPEQRLCYPG